MMKNKFNLINIAIFFNIAFVAIFIFFWVISDYFASNSLFDTGFSYALLVIFILSLLSSISSLIKERHHRGKKWWLVLFSLVLLLLFALFLAGLFYMAWVISTHARP